MGREDRVCCDELADHIRALARMAAGTGGALVAFLRGKALRHCINLLNNHIR
jgi:hypothetical protein